MNMTITKIGDSTCLILPEELLARLRLEQGDQGLVSAGPDRTLTITPCNSDDEETMWIAREVMKEYAFTFRALAK